VRLLLDEMYPPTLADALNGGGIEVATVAELGLAGSSDVAVLEAGVIGGYAVLTENVGDFVRLASERLTAGRHRCGILIALSTRFSRRPAGLPAVATAVRSVAAEDLNDRVVYLEHP
jgi:predicted nuclease of predicted toxin-antitoxin system